jgi:hypothetical protein
MIKREREKEMIYEKKKKKTEGGFSSSRPLLPLRPMVHTH